MLMSRVMDRLKWLICFPPGDLPCQSVAEPHFSLVTSNWIIPCVHICTKHCPDLSLLFCDKKVVERSLIADNFYRTP